MTSTIGMIELEEKPPCVLIAPTKYENLSLRCQ